MTVIKSFCFLYLISYACVAEDCGCGKNLNRQNLKDVEENVLENSCPLNNDKSSEEDSSIINDRLVEDKCSSKKKVDLDDELIKPFYKKLPTDNMIKISAGSYFIGTNDPIFVSDGEGPRREVKLDSFYIDKYEVSNSDFAEFVKATSHKTEAEIFGDSFVFEGLLSDETKDKIKQAVAQAPWWLPVKNATWKNPEGLDSDILGRVIKFLKNLFVCAYKILSSRMKKVPTLIKIRFINYI